MHSIAMHRTAQDTKHRVKMCGLCVLLVLQHAQWALALLATAPAVAASLAPMGGEAQPMTAAAAAASPAQRATLVTQGPYQRANAGNVRLWSGICDLIGSQDGSISTGCAATFVLHAAAA